MKRSVLFLAAFSLAALPAAAADKTHQQMMAEIRMLQEQQSQLIQAVSGLADTLKSMTAKIDDGTGGMRKGFADQKVLVDTVAENVRILREKADDTNVRLATMSQELESLRQTMSSMSVAAPAPVSGVTGDPTAPTAPTGAPAQPPPAGVSPQKAWDAAFNDYTSGQHDLAIAGFEFFIKSFPTHIRAGEAQLNIGNAHYNLGNFSQAVSAFQKVISDFGQSSAVPTAYYKLGLSYEQLKQLDLARRAYETVIKNYPTALVDASLAKQRLDALAKKED